MAYIIVRPLHFLVLLFITASLAVGQMNRSDLTEKREAEKAWEALIRAKGGRKKLHSIKSMVTQSADITRLDVFPCSSWEFGRWLDLSMRLEVYNGTSKVKTVGGEKGPTSIKQLESTLDCKLNQIPFLLETSWFQPDILRVTREKVDKKKFDVIETLTDGRRIDFVYEPEEMLVSEVRFHSRFGDGLYQKYRFYSYTTIDGIKMPRAFRIGTELSKFEGLEKNDIPIKFTFNVDFDPKIFEPPFAATSADAWKRKQ